jgi:fructose-1,6-bisphosphatase/inositol monophosphatase family enzyme
MNDNLIAIEGEVSYKKDPFTSAILNTDLAMLAEVKQKRKQTKIISEMQKEIDSLKKEIALIKSHINLG